MSFQKLTLRKQGLTLSHSRAGSMLPAEQANNALRMSFGGPYLQQPGRARRQSAVSNAVMNRVSAPQHLVPVMGQVGCRWMKVPCESACSPAPQRDVCLGVVMNYEGKGFV